MTPMTRGQTLPTTENLKQLCSSSENMDPKSNIIDPNDPNFTIRIRGGNVPDILRELRDNLDTGDTSCKEDNTGPKIRLIEDNLNLPAAEPPRKKIKMREEALLTRVTLVLPNDMPTKITPPKKTPSPGTPRAAASRPQQCSKKINSAEKRSNIVNSTTSPFESPITSRPNSLHPVVQFKRCESSGETTETSSEFENEDTTPESPQKPPVVRTLSVNRKTKNVPNVSQKEASTSVSSSSSARPGRPRRVTRKPACRGCAGECSMKKHEDALKQGNYTLRPVITRLTNFPNLNKSESKPQNNSIKSEISTNVSEAIKDLETAQTTLVIDLTDQSPSQFEMNSEQLPDVIQVKEEPANEDPVVDTTPAVKSEINPPPNNNPTDCQNCQKLRSEVNRQWQMFTKLEADLAEFSALTGDINSSDQFPHHADFENLDNINSKLTQMVREERIHSNDLLTRLIEREKYIKQLHWKMDCISNIFKSTMNNALMLKVEMDSDEAPESTEPVSFEPVDSDSSEYADYEALECLDITETSTDE